MTHPPLMARCWDLFWQRLGASKIVAIVSTTSCFSPRAHDRLEVRHTPPRLLPALSRPGDFSRLVSWCFCLFACSFVCLQELAVLAEKYDIGHIVNNACVRTRANHAGANAKRNAASQHTADTNTHVVWQVRRDLAHLHGLGGEGCGGRESGRRGAVDRQELHGARRWATSLPLARSLARWLARHQLESLQGCALSQAVHTVCCGLRLIVLGWQGGRSWQRLSDRNQKRGSEGALQVPATDSLYLHCSCTQLTPCHRACAAVMRAVK
jgi:hypothetical protein